MIPVLLGVSFFVFTLLYFAPGDPAAIVLGGDATPEAILAWRTEQGLEDPFFVQYFNFIWGVISRFDFGTSYTTGKEVTGQLMSAFPITLTLALPVTIIAVIIGTALGILAAYHRGGVIDAIARFVGIVGVSVPTFWAAPMLILLFSVTLQLLPVSGWYGPRYAVLPIMSMSLYAIAANLRMARSSVLECMRQDYVVTAKAKGVDGKRLTFKHILKNALIPVITNAGISFGTMMGGSLVMDQIFSIPGLGILLVTAVKSRDYPQIRGSVLLLAVTFSVINLLVDILYAFLDPRIKAQFQSKNKKKVKIEKKEAA